MYALPLREREMTSKDKEPRPLMNKRKKKKEVAAAGNRILVSIDQSCLRAGREAGASKGGVLEYLN